MNANIVETLSRHAAQSVSRRGSLLTLGGALAASVAAPSLALAGKSRKKGKRKSRKNASQDAEEQANQVCASQVAGCRSDDSLIAAQRQPARVWPPRSVARRSASAIRPSSSSCLVAVSS